MPIQQRPMRPPLYSSNTPRQLLPYNSPNGLNHSPYTGSHLRVRPLQPAQRAYYSSRNYHGSNPPDIYGMPFNDLMQLIHTHILTVLDTQELILQAREEILRRREVAVSQLESQATRLNSTLNSVNEQFARLQLAPAPVSPILPNSSSTDR